MHENTQNKAVKNSCFDDLVERGIIQQTTDDQAVKNLIDSGEAILYWGCDPTGISAHVGHLLGLVTLRRLQLHGNQAIILLGGATGLIGDPSGKSSERILLSEDEVKTNQTLLLGSIAQVIDLFSESKTRIVNNIDWFSKINIPEFLRNVGKHFSLSNMLRLESVKSRLDSEAGISFTEFTYSLLQAFDFRYLYDQYGCRLQIGGADQYGNIVAGIEYTRRTCGAKVYGMTTPLISTSTGAKMGKTASGGAIFLAPDLTSPYDFYQYWINTTDEDTEKLLLLYTFIPVEEIKNLVAQDIMRAKKRLAFEVTAIVHSKEEALQAKLASEAMFSGNDVFSIEGVPEIELSQQAINNGLNATELYVLAGLAASNSAARRLIQQGGAYINNAVIKDVNYQMGPEDIQQGYIVLRAGKKKYCRVHLVDTATMVTVETEA